MRRRWQGLVVAVALLGAPGAAPGSERSQLLVTRGQVAYQGRRFEEARGLFAEAAAADPADAPARYGLGLALARLGRSDEAAAALRDALAVRPDFDEARRALALVERARSDTTGPAEVAAPAARRWQLRASSGFQYDSNVPLLPHTSGAPQRADGAAVLSAGGSFDLARSEQLLLRLDYDFYQTLHFSLEDFNFRSQQIAGTASWAFLPWLGAGVQGGYAHYTLGDHSYLQEPFVLPFVSFAEAAWGTTQLSYRYGEEQYLSAPFDDVRDGPSEAVGFDQRLFLDGAGRYVTLGYEYRRDRPRPAAGRVYDRRVNQAYTGVGFPLGWETAAELIYLYANDDYTRPNDQAAFQKTRTDNEHHLHAALRRALGERVHVQLAYWGTINTSNIGTFDYRRNVVSVLFDVTY